MTKKLIVSAAVLALAGSAMAAGPANSGTATTTTTTSSSQTKSTASNKDSVDPAMANEQARRLGVEQLKDLENDSLVDSQGKVIGEVDRLGRDSASGDILLVIGLDGITEENMKEVAILIQDVTKIGEDRLQTTLTKTELQQKRDIDPWDGAYSQNVPK